MKCCQCDKDVELGPQAVKQASEVRDTLAVRCAYCLQVFCRKCSMPHFARTKRLIKKTVTEETWEEK